MKATPVTERCHRSFTTRKHVCFGISPFNSYFSELRIQELAEWGKTEFQTMHFFVPDVPSAYTLEALGYDSEKAAWKARRQSQYLFNKIHKALKAVGFSIAQADPMILHWDRLQSSSRFMTLYNEVTELFELDLDFHDACLNASRWVLEKRVADPEDLSLSTLKSAVRYLLTEIPLFVDSAGILEQDSSVFCYHQCISFIEKLLKGDFRVPVSRGQGFVVID
jgi:cyclo(L-tyrosyl-L-tyrosyl) synthase